MSFIDFVVKLNSALAFMGEMEFLIVWDLELECFLCLPDFVYSACIEMVPSFVVFMIYVILVKKVLELL